tara:strand:- start:13375 stop:13641 length:267 start_codon:yes stop_codon:yes gene_type:complete
MKQSGNALGGASIDIHFNDTFTATKAFIGSLARKALIGMARIMLALRVSRMTSALATMSDEQLDQIGVHRKDISDHARKLITYEYDGL